MKINPAKRLSGTINLPGDKSISHRAALFSAMATGAARIENFASSADCASTLECLRELGVAIRRENSTVFVEGVGKNGFQTPLKNLDCGNSGTTVRLLAGILAGQNFDAVLIGDESLSKRPMRRVIEPLTQMNARIEATENRLPMTIRGTNPLKAISYRLPVASAQVKSCVLLAGLNAEGKTTVINPESKNRIVTSRNHTELMLEYLGADLRENFIETENGFIQEITIDGGSRLEGRNLSVPSDISSAAFFIVAAACLPGSEIILRNVGLNPTRTAIIDVVRNCGASVEILDGRENGNEKIGDIRVSGGESFSPQQGANVISGEIVANLIDEVPILAVFGTQMENGLEIRDASELRVKESDRIAAVVENLRRMNARVEEFPDGLRVEKSDLKAASIESFGDHRIAMAFSVAALFASGETEISGAECAAVSFPEFYDVLNLVVN